MRHVSRSIKAALLVFALAFLALGAVVPGAAHAATTPTCSVVDGVYVCSDGSGGSTGSVCVTDNTAGTQACLTPGGGTTTSGLSSLGRGLGQVLGLPSQSASTGWLSQLTGWVANVVHTFFSAIVQVLKDLVTYVLGVILGLVVTAISAVGTPSFLADYSLGTVLGQAGPVVGFFLAQFQIPAGLAMIGTGYAFRLARKFLTLFQW